MPRSRVHESFGLLQRPPFSRTRTTPRWLCSATPISSAGMQQPRLHSLACLCSCVLLGRAKEAILRHPVWSGGVCVPLDEATRLPTSPPSAWQFPLDELFGGKRAAAAAAAPAAQRSLALLQANSTAVCMCSWCAAISPIASHLSLALCLPLCLASVLGPVLGTYEYVLPSMLVVCVTGRVYPRRPRAS